MQKRTLNKIFTRSFIFVAMLAQVGLTACGGLTSSSSDSSDLTTSQINAISAALTLATNDVNSDYSTTTPTLVDGTDNLVKNLTSTYALSGESLCPADGHITYSGNVVATASETSASIYGQITWQVSDPTNNLNDCEIIQDDLIIDGTLYLTFSGTDTAGVSMTLVGYLGINERGPTGGLVPIADDCYIYIYYSASGTTSGTVCGYSVSS